MESRIGWLGGSLGEKQVDETLVFVDTYTCEEVRLTSEQHTTAKAFEQAREASLKDLMEWLSVETI